MQHNRRHTLVYLMILSALLVISVGIRGEQADAKEAGDATDAKSVEQLQKEFRDLKFGMFIHYNMATYKDVEWVEGYPSPADFNPGVETIDTDGWAEAAKAAGMKYAVLTVKHVGGFCLWDSKYTTYDIMHPDCPYKKDIVGQFVKSFTDRGIKVGLYYCWRHPGFGDPQKHKVLPPECDPATHTLEEQIEFQKKQIAELVDKYPQVFYIWNDALDPRVMPADEAKKFFRDLGPNIIAASNWWNWGKKGQKYLDVGVKELRHFPEGPTTDTRETCFKLQGSWFWKKGLKTAKENAGPIPAAAVGKASQGQLANMQNAHRRHSNYLLNINPDINGSILPFQAAVLAEMGKMAAESAQDAE